SSCSLCAALAPATVDIHTLSLHDALPIFGEMSLMTGEPRSATIQALSDCELVKVDKAAFHEILAAAPEIAEKITDVLAARQSERSEEHTSELQSRENLVCRLLLEQKKTKQ